MPATRATTSVREDRGHWSSDVVLADGGTVRIRAADASDVDAVGALLRGLSRESRYRRFMSGGPCDGILDFLADLGGDRHLALVAEADGALVGVVECLALPAAGRSEVAFAVADDQQHRGVGTALLEHVAALAATRGVDTLVASTLFDNAAMLGVFREAGFAQRRSMHAGVVDVELALAPVPPTAGRAPVRDAPATVPVSIGSVLGGLRAFAVMSGGPVLLLAAVAAAAGATARDIAESTPPSVAALVVLAGAAVYAFAVVPWTRRWGTFPAERDAVLPGDEFVPHAGLRMTRAITIDAAPEHVWPWLAQIGADRGGFYSYAWLENLAGCHLENADRVHPEWTRRGIGGTVALHPLHGIPITRFEPPWSFAMGGWYFVLEALPGGRTRLLARTRVPRGAAAWAYAAFIELPHFVMERRMLLGIRSRAEAARDTARA